MRRNMLVEQLRESAREWSRLSIAETLLDRTRRKFEQERQPSVIQYAKDIFCHITGHRYRGLYAPIGEQTITVTDAHGGSKLPAELSRGTREQLYLALRFGLILEFGEHAERLPVVVDEALVNFDPERLVWHRRLLPVCPKPIRSWSSPATTLSRICSSRMALGCWTSAATAIDSGHQDFEGGPSVRESI